MCAFTGTHALDGGDQEPEAGRETGRLRRSWRSGNVEAATGSAIDIVCPTAPGGRAVGREDRGGEAMEDKKVIDRINELAHEEREIFEKESSGRATDGERERLKRIEVTLDQCWDLLHQRRARRSAGLDPDDAQVRDAKTVEGYIG
jgi:hypothetical protein